MPIHDRNLKAGTKLIGKYHKQPYKCEVVEVEGKLRFRLEDGREFKSPSAAGMAITGHPCDGWVFWSVETASVAPTTEVQQTETQQESEQAAPSPETEENADNFYRTSNISNPSELLQDGMAESGTERPDPVALQPLQQTLPGSCRYNARDLPAGPQSQLIPPDNRVTTFRQAPVKWGLFFVVLAKITNPQ